VVEQADGGQDDAGFSRAIHNAGLIRIDSTFARQRRFEKIANMTATADRIIVICPNCSAKNRVDPVAAAVKQPVCGHCKTPLIAPAVSPASGVDDHPVELTDANFDSFLQSAGDKPVLVDFWATWCPPCRMLAPTIEQLAKESAGRYVIAKLDTDQSPRTAARFQISGIPTMIIFERGQKVDQLVGVAPKEAIAGKLMQFA
jgi:thioredoxin 1